MTIGLMRRFPSSARTRCFNSLQGSLAARRVLRLRRYQNTFFAPIPPRPASTLRSWFTSSPPCLHSGLGNSEQQRLNERNLKLGHTIRALRDHLPTLLVLPLPQNILSPHITLHLFPSTHPHLPTVGGKIAYTAALWTAPVAWGRVPVVGNVKLKILSERMVKNSSTSMSSLVCNEKLIVRWRTCGGSEDGKEYREVSDTVNKIMNIVSGSTRPNEEFAGLFIFEFDEEGRIINHIIEHTDEGRYWDKTAKVISVTDWLLGRAWGRREEGSPGLAFAPCSKERSRHGSKSR